MSGPLDGVIVLNPRARHQASDLSVRIRALGGRPVEAPTIAIAEGDTAALDAALQDLADGAFSAVCFTSPNGAAAVGDALERVGRDTRVFAATPLVAALGPGTAEAMWEALRLRPDLVPEASTTASLADAFPSGDGRVLLPRADIATNALAEGLMERGYEPVEVAAYRTVLPPALDPDVLAELGRGGIDVIAFASSSTVRNFVELVGGAPWQATVVSIGPVTSATCRELGIEPDVEADPHDLDGLVEAIVRGAGR